MPRDVVGLLVTTFQELRAGQTQEGTAIKGLDAVMSTAEAVNVAYAAALRKAGYATDPEYARKLSGAIQSALRAMA